jgi:hypothetical protein
MQNSDRFQKRITDRLEENPQHERLHFGLSGAQCLMSGQLDFKMPEESRARSRQGALRGPKALLGAPKVLLFYPVVLAGVSLGA